MSDQPIDPNAQDPALQGSMPRSLKELIDQATGRSLPPTAQAEDSGLAESLPYPFLAIVGQEEMKMALLVAVINPLVGGALLIGHRGAGKTTAVRSLANLLPHVAHSLCYYGCTEQDLEHGGMDAVCPDCARKFAMGEPLTRPEAVRLFELPLNAKLEDVVGGWDERPGLNPRQRIRRGILAQADQNLLFVDEVNLLSDEIVNAILDAAAQGTVTLRRSGAAAIYRARFSLIGSMNPEEGRLRSQILDRFGLRVITRGLDQPLERLEAYQRSRAHRMNPHAMIATYAQESIQAQAEIQSARQLLPQVELPSGVASVGLEWVKALQIDSLRAEITLFEAARALAAADARLTVSIEDLRRVAPLALRMRRSTFLNRFFAEVAEEEEEIRRLVG